MSHETPVLEAETRTKLGSRYSHRLRQAGRLPAVVYGHKQGPVHVSVDARTFNDIADSSAHLIEIKVDGNAEPCLIKAIQYDHLDRHAVHADFARVDLDEAVEIELAIEFTGEAEGLKEAGAMLDVPHGEVVVSCKANAIPDNLTFDISSMQIDVPVHAKELPLPDGVTLVSEPEMTIAQIVIRAAVADDTDGDVEAEGGGEPEVIDKGGDGDASGD